jgi:hypothetical protein
MGQVIYITFGKCSANHVIGTPYIDTGTLERKG